MEILVTGASGFLGAHLCRALEARGERVTRLGTREADLRVADSLAPFERVRYDQIFHLAAWTQAGDFCLHHPGEQWVINQLINTNVLAWWQAAQPQAKLVAIGTSCSYAPGQALVETNYMEGTPIPSLYPYAMTKRMLYVGLQVLRKIVAGRFQDEPVVLWGDGHQKRELIHVDDFVTALLGLTERVDNDIVNIGSGVEYSIRAFADILCRHVGYAPARIAYDTTRHVGATSKVLNVSKLQQLLPEFRQRPLEEGLRETVAWYLQALALPPAEGAPT